MTVVLLSLVYSNLLVISPDVPIWLIAIECTGSESNLIDCPQRAGNYSCDHNTDVGLICANSE